MKPAKPMMLLLLAAALAAPFPVLADVPAATEDGLQRVPLAGIDVAYVRPGASIAGYSRVLLGPVSIAFRGGWERDVAPGPNKRVSESDMQKTRERLGTLLHEEVVKALTAGGYVIADAPSADVMQLDLGVSDLYVTMPQQRQGPDEVYAFTAGEMILVAEVSDSVSGEIQARIFDHAKAKESHQMQRISRAENAREARKIAEAWAQTIRERLDAARAKTAPAP